MGVPRSGLLTMSQEPDKQHSAAFDCSIWRHALSESRRASNRQRLQMLEKVWHAIEKLSHTYGWEELYIFGSATKKGRFGEGSDIDVAIGGLDKFLHYRFIADLSGLIEREVDVVRLEDCAFADAIRSRGIRWKKER